MAARLLFLFLVLFAGAVLLYQGGEYVLSFRREEGVYLAQEAPLVRIMAPEGEEKRNVNRASADELQLVPGIGPVLAQRIVDYREEQGGFYFLEEVMDVPGVGEKRLEALRELFDCR